MYSNLTKANFLHLTKLELRGAGASGISAPQGKRQATPWTGYQSQGSHRDREPFTPMGNLESPVINWQLAHLERLHHCRKVNTGFRATYALVQTTSF